MKRSSCGNCNGNISHSSTSPKVLVVETNTQRFAMALKSESIVCGHNGYKTGDDTIIVLQGSPSTLPDHGQPEVIHYLNASHNMDLKLVYLERNIMNTTIDLYKLFTQRYCELTKDHLHSLINLARSNAEEFVWIYMRKPGYTAVVRGEVLYLIQCKPVKVISSDKFYQDLVVKNLQKKHY